MRTFIATLVLLAYVSCSKTNSEPQYQFKKAPTPGLAAQVGDIKISNQEVESGIESEIYEAEQKLFELKFNRLKGMIVERLMESDPKKKGLTTDQYLDRFIAKDVKVSDGEIEAFIKKQNIPKQHVNEGLKQRINQYLLAEKKKEQVEKWLGEKTKKTPIEVYLKKPRRPTFKVTVGDSPSWGSEKAKVTLVEFSDFQCPYCAKGADLINQLKKKYGKSKLRVVFKNYTIPFHNQAEKAANITLVDVRAVGAFGRLTIAGSESNVDEAAQAAIDAIHYPMGT